MMKTERGVTLIETMIAILIALFVMAALGGVVFTATVQNKNQGVEMSRVTVYAQDKIETLMNLDWYDCTAGTPAAGCNTTGISASGWNLGLKPGGTLTRASACPASGPTVGYIDFLDSGGNKFTGSDCTAVGNYAYQRQWLVTDLITTAANTPGLKRIDVIVWSRNAVNTGSASPSTTLTTYISE